MFSIENTKTPLMQNLRMCYYNMILMAWKTADIKNFSGNTSQTCLFIKESLIKN